MEQNDQLTAGKSIVRRSGAKRAHGKVVFKRASEDQEALRAQ